MKDFKSVKNKYGETMCRVKYDIGGKQYAEVKSKKPVRMEVQDFIKELKKLME